jgi:hypothetical protein
MMKTLAVSTLVLAAFASPANAAVVISSGATSHMTCASGVCTPTAKNAVLNAGDLQTMLATSDVSVNTGAGALSIAISSPLTWASTSRLTLNGTQGVAIRASVVVEGTGGLTLAGGALNFYPGGSIAFWDNTSSLVIAGNAYTLVSDLATLASDVESNPNGLIALAKDVDASGSSFSDAVVTTTLTGTFEGLGHTISNLSFSAFDPFVIGLFAQVSGTVRDIAVGNGTIDCDPEDTAAVQVGFIAGENGGTLKNVSASGTIDCIRGRDVGGIAGDNDASAVIMDATANVAILQAKVHEAGGLVGANAGTIRSSSASGNVNGAEAGGLVGTTSGTIADSHATGRVTNTSSEGGYNLGGLAGWATGGTILRSYATGNVSSRNIAGGLVGLASGVTIDSAFATGSATSTKQGGGLIGKAQGVKLTNSYARGAASGSTARVGYAGGLLGWSGGNGSNTVTAAYSTGAPVGGKYTGGSTGRIDDDAAMTTVYWDLDTSGVTDPSRAVGNLANYPGIAGLSDTALKAGLPSGFDPSVWAQSPGINDGYPYLIANPPQ